MVLQTWYFQNNLKHKTSVDKSILINNLRYQQKSNTSQTFLFAQPHLQNIQEIVPGEEFPN